MSNNLSVFNFEGTNEVRTMTDERDNSVWFVLRDVLAAMNRKGTRTNESKASINTGLGMGTLKPYPFRRREEPRTSPSSVNQQ